MDQCELICGCRGMRDHHESGDTASISQRGLGGRQLAEAETSFLMAHPKQSVHPNTVHTRPREIHLACFIHVFAHTFSHTSKMNYSEGKN